MRLAAGLLVAAGLPVLAGCVTPPPPRPVTPAARSAPVAQPLPDAAADEPPPVTTRSFLVRGRHFPIGQSASLKVCVSPDGAIASVEVTRSSGEPTFDEFAMVWARQADVSQWVRKDQQVESCGSVRVEIGRGARPGLGRGADTALG